MVNEQQQQVLIDDATPSPHFAVAPYTAVLLNDVDGWSCVMNAHGVNCLTFKSHRGAVITDYSTAKRIADHWNQFTGIQKHGKGESQ